MNEILKKATTAPVLRTLLFVFIGSLLALGLGCKKATNASSTTEAPQKAATELGKTANNPTPTATPAAATESKKETAKQDNPTKAPDEKPAPIADISDAGTTGTAATITKDVEETAAPDADTKNADTDAESADADTVNSQDTDAAAIDADTAGTEAPDGLDAEEQAEETNTDESEAPQEETNGEDSSDEASDESDESSNDTGSTDRDDAPEQDGAAGGDTPGQQAANAIAPPQVQFDDEGREIVTGDDGGKAVVMDTDPTTGALTEQERLQMVLLCGQLACLHEVSGAMPRDQASKLLLTQLGFAQTDYDKHLPGIFGDREAGSACDGMRSLCSDNPDREEPSGRLNRTQKKLLTVLIALVNGPAAGETLKAVDGATVLAAYKELQTNPLFAREFLNASWGYIQTQAPTPAAAPGPVTPRAPQPPQDVRNTAPATHRFVGTLSDSAGNTTGTIRFRVKADRITHGSVALNGQAYAMPSSTVEKDGAFSAGAKAGKDFIQLTGTWKSGRSWIRGTYSGFASRKRVRGIFSLATR